MQIARSPRPSPSKSPIASALPNRSADAAGAERRPGSWPSPCERPSVRGAEPERSRWALPASEAAPRFSPGAPKARSGRALPSSEPTASARPLRRSRALLGRAEDPARRQRHRARAARRRHRRKNHDGSRSRRGTEVAALFYSLIESAKLCGVEQKDYLRKAAIAAIRDRTVLLPHQLAA
jgi:hypothetical protein